jgi:predicted RNA-binding Zn-ribbon protein involved in translation (DUF1610 family)
MSVRYFVSAAPLDGPQHVFSVDLLTVYADSLADLADAGFGMAEIPPYKTYTGIYNALLDRPDDPMLTAVMEAAEDDKPRPCPRCGSNTRPRADEHPLTPQPEATGRKKTKGEMIVERWMNRDKGYYDLEVLRAQLAADTDAEIEAEREACAKLVEDGADDGRFECPVCASQIAHAIRARATSSPPSP